MTDSLLPDGHDGLDVTNSRIREAHSLMAAEWLDGDEEVHRVYKQGHDERCYICALLALNQRYREALDEIAEHTIVSEGEFPDDNCDWHCTLTMQARAKDALSG